MTIFYPRSPGALDREVKAARSCSLTRDKSSSIATKVCHRSKINIFLSTGRVPGSLRLELEVFLFMGVTCGHKEISVILIWHFLMFF